MGPLEILYGWEAMLCAIVCSGVTQLVKTIFDITITQPKRRASLWINRVVMPLIPILTGAIYATVVPFLPDVLTAWFVENDVAQWQHIVGKAIWGGACGQFSTFLYDRVKRTMRDMSSKPASTM